ncbi:hypothetical protein Q3G72_015014 [Acer saccharum]|nr:hypothetical protein Q3G72_015014 [Acer saccharum]
MVWFSNNVIPTDSDENFNAMFCDCEGGSNEIAAGTATSNFNPENMLGEGGFRRVYSGNIEGTNQVVADKQLDRNAFQGNREFLVEVLMLSLLCHPHLVNLVGYCADGDQRILVYEHMVNGSLEDHLLGMSENISICSFVFE